MAHKTFISYKYDEAQNVRDQILRHLGENAIYYKGETSQSPDLTDLKTETIRRKLKDMIFGTSVTIVVVSRNMNKSKWIPWEIEYSLRKETRGNQTSAKNGIVAVIMPDVWYDWKKFIPDVLAKNIDCVVYVPLSKFLANATYYIDCAVKVSAK